MSIMKPHDIMWKYLLPWQELLLKLKMASIKFFFILKLGRQLRKMSADIS